jgi:hypothetical protein
MTQYLSTKLQGTPNSDLLPWENIYPKGKDGLPVYNASGKYAIKLFWIGKWRKVFVDDKVPVDDEGKPLILTSAMAGELWPVLITKAVIKAAYGW